MANVTSTDFGELWEQLLQGKDVLKVSQYTIVASATLFIYDMVLTFEDELELVWKRSLWTFPALLYIGNRYVTLFCLLLINYQISPFRPAISKSAALSISPWHSCKEGVSVVGFSVGIASWGGIMALRVAALWKSRKLVVWIVWLSWLLTVIIMTAGAIVIYVSLLPSLAYNPIYGVCTANATTSVQTALPAIQAVFVLIVTLFTVVKAYQVPSHLRGLKDVSQVMSLLLRDGVVYFLVAAVLSIASGISWMILPAASASNRIYLFVYLNWSIFSTIVARLFLRLRKMFYRNYALSVNPYSPSFYSTTIAWNHDSGIIEPVIENDVSQFFQDEEFAVMSIHDPGDGETFLLALDINISMGILSPTSGHRFFREDPIFPQRDAPGTAGSGSRPRTGTSAHQGTSGRPQTGTNTRPQTGSSIRPQTGGNPRPQTA